MSDIVPFDFDGRQVRVIVDLEGNPWWVAADVCAVLGIANVGNTLARLDSGDIHSADVVDSAGRRQATRIVNESGLYDLVLDSRKPEARRFRRWITSEVLPSLRRDGSYAIAANRPPSQIDVLRAALDQIEAAQVTAEEARELARRTEARVDAIEGQHDWVSALGFARLHGLSTSSQWLNKLGRAASEVARRGGIEPVKVPHAYYGSANSYPEWVWQAAYDSRRV